MRSAPTSWYTGSTFLGVRMLGNIGATILTSLLLGTALNAHASIIGMLQGSPQNQFSVRLQNDFVLLSVTGPQDYPELYLSRNIASEGGPTVEVMAALQRGETYIAKVSNWIQPKDGRMKIGIFMDRERMGFRSMFSGLVIIPFVTAERIMRMDLPDGRMVQIYRFPVQPLLEQPDVPAAQRTPAMMDFVVQERAEGEMDDHLVTLPQMENCESFLK